MHVDLYLFYTDNKNPDERNSLNSIVFNLTARILFIRFLLLIFLDSFSWTNLVYFMFITA